MNGYIFNSAEHGAYSPDGKVEGSPTQAEIDAHNKQLAQAEWINLQKSGKGLLYVFSKDGKPTHAGTWDGSYKVAVNNFRHGSHNIARQRLDVWFYIDGARFHGVNIGDNDILRVKKVKS